MENLKEYIESGILEAYVLGLASAEEQVEVEEMAASYVEVRVAMNKFSESYQQYSETTITEEPHPTIRPLVLASINFLNRMEKGEKLSSPPMLSANSKIADFEEWLNRDDMVLPPESDDIYARIIAHDTKATTAIVWIKAMAPQEVHHDEYERFLIVEGSCTISVAEDNYELKPGDFFEIPLHSNHYLQVTSSIPCKAILQRVAA